MLNPNFILSIRILLIVVAAIALTVIIVTNKKINKQIKNCSGAEYYQTQRIILMFWIVVVMIVGICWNVLFELKKIIMEKNIKDYLHLYIGCEVSTPDGFRKMLCYNNYFDLVYVETNPETIAPSKAYYTYHINEVKPVLRTLSNMNDEEDKECSNIMFGEFASKVVRKNIIHYEGEKIKYLLSKHFDLFNLIEAGLAIDKTTLK